MPRYRLKSDDPTRKFWYPGYGLVRPGRLVGEEVAAHFEGLFEEVPDEPSVPAPAPKAAPEPEPEPAAEAAVDSAWDEPWEGYDEMNAKVVLATLEEYAWTAEELGLILKYEKEHGSRKTVKREILSKLKGLSS